MADQGAAVDEPSEPISRSIAALLRDLSRMADLQLQLFSVDVQEFWTGARNRIAVACTGTAMIIGCIPVLLFALAGAIERHTLLNTEAAQFLVALITLTAGSTILWMAIRRVGAAAEKLRRSQDELQRNLNWVRHALHRYRD